MTYDTIQNGNPTSVSTTVAIETPVRMDYTGDLLTYTTNKGNKIFLGNPNGQFHLFSNISTEMDYSTSTATE